MERGQFTFLTLVLGGEENDQLRRKIIESLAYFEVSNRETLEKWRGVAKDARGVDDLLSSMLAAS
jgi:Trp operon repressor